MAMMMVEIIVRTAFERRKMILLLKNFKNEDLKKQRDKIKLEIASAEAAKASAKGDMSTHLAKTRDWLQVLKENSVS
jgi:hypothetical protein